MWWDGGIYIKSMIDDEELHTPTPNQITPAHKHGCLPNITALSTQNSGLITFYFA